MSWKITPKGTVQIMGSTSPFLYAGDQFKSKQLEYIPGIDGLRAIAVLSVIAFHFDSSLLPGGFSGVDVFFVISGYVISKSIVKNYQDSFATYLLEFYKRRLLRILPALLLCLIVTSIISALFVPPSWLSQKNAITGISAFFGLSNFFLLSGADGYFSERVSFNPFVHTWSLAVEEQFYLIFPLLIFLWLKPQGQESLNRTAYRYLIPVLAITSIVYSSVETNSNQQFAFYLLPSRFWELSAGAMLFQCHSKGFIHFNSKNRVDFRTYSGMALLVFGFLYSEGSNFPFPWALAPVIGTVLLISSAINTVDNLSTIQKFLCHKSTVYIGKISYSLYLWHWPVLTLFRWTVGVSSLYHMVVAAIIILLLSVFSYHAVETFFQRNSLLRSQPSWLLVVGSISIVLFSAIFCSQLLNRPWVFNQSITVSDTNWKGKLSASELRRYSSVDNEVSGRTLYVVGDSHAGAYNTMLKIVSAQLGIKINMNSFPGCPIVSLVKPYPKTNFCIEYVRQTIRDIENQAKPGDILFFASLRSYLLGNQTGPFDQADIEAAKNSPEAEQNRKESLDQAGVIITGFHKMGLHILIDGPKPVFMAPPFRCADWFNHMNPVCAPGFTISRDFLHEHNIPITNALMKLKKQFPFIFVWDPFPILCSADLCSAYDATKPLFFDGDHLSGHGNRLLAPSFKSKILDILSTNQNFS